MLRPMNGLRGDASGNRDPTMRLWPAADGTRGAGRLGLGGTRVDDLAQMQQYTHFVVN